MNAKNETKNCTNVGTGHTSSKNPTCSLDLGFPDRPTNLVSPNVCSARVHVGSSDNTKNWRRRATGKVPGLREAITYWDKIPRSAPPAPRVTIRYDAEVRESNRPDPRTRQADLTRAKAPQNSEGGEEGSGSKGCLCPETYIAG